MNPLDLFRMNAAMQRFNRNHPKFGPFLRAAKDKALQEGSVIAVSVTAPDGETIETNLRVLPDDLDMMQEFLKRKGQ